VIQILYERAGFAPDAIEEFLENAAFATVGDVMDLQDENRIIVKEGLKRLRNTSNYGMRALIAQNNIEPGNISAYHIGFVLGPCVNASGRLETARRALSLFLKETPEEAAEAAKELVELNIQRKDMTAEGVELAREEVAKGNAGDKVLVIYLPDVHESLAGIIAGRIRESEQKPTFVITKSDDGAKGSGRSIEAYSMYDELCKCSELFTKFGGHPMAAGISLRESDVDVFRKKINDCCQLTEEDFIPKIGIDIAMPVSYPDIDLVRQIDALEPFGKGNPKPLFADRNLAIERAWVVGKNRNVLRLNLITEEHRRVSAVYFGDVEQFRVYYTDKYSERDMAAAYAGHENAIRMSIAYYPEINTYQGADSVQIVIRNYK
jgi:single-stranded-DNA-specific exonuclease